jgi:hypothetical protein
MVVYCVERKCVGVLKEYGEFVRDEGFVRW